MRYHPQPKKTATEAHRRPELPPPRRRARPLCARWLVRLPVRLALRRSGRGAGEFVPRPSGDCVRRPCPRPAPRARRSRLRRPRCFCGSMGRSALMAKGGGWLSRPSAVRPAPSPPASPPRRRPLAWSCRCWAWGGGGATPAPAGRLCAVRLGGLAAGRALPCVRVTGWRVACSPSRRGRGAPPAACVGGFVAFGFASAALARSCGRARGVFFPPNNPPFFPVALARRDAENLS